MYSLNLDTFYYTVNLRVSYQPLPGLNTENK